VDVYDSATAEWASTNLPRLSGSLRATTVGARVLFTSILPGDQTPSPTVDIYDSTTGEWSTTELSRAGLGQSVGQVDGVALFAVGAGGGDTWEVVDIYDGGAVSGSATPPASPTPR
jgi:hypothetical protein